jgi:hypothetical protein
MEHHPDLCRVGDMAADSNPRPAGVSSRLRHGHSRRRQAWTAENGQVVELPVVLDLVEVDPRTRNERWRVEATVDLVDGEPALCHVELQSADGLDTLRLQREFRWMTPVDAVRRIAPAMLADGLDPFDQDFPFTGYPHVARARDLVDGRLTDEFLEDVATEYLSWGRGYADRMATEHRVSKRTVVGWVVKARERGILSQVRPGQYGGELVPRSKRRPVR